MPARTATSSRRRPETRRRSPPYTGSPACPGLILARRVLRNSRISPRMSQFVRLAEAAKLDAERCMDAPLACRDGIAEIGDETVGGDQQRDPRGRAGRHGKGLDHHEAGARVSADHGPGAQVHDIGDELAARFDLELARRQVADQQPVMCRVTGADAAGSGHPVSGLGS